MAVMMVGMDRGGKYGMVFEMAVEDLEIREYFNIYQLFYS